MGELIDSVDIAAQAVRKVTEDGVVGGWYNFRRFFSQTDNDGDTLLAFDPPIEDVGGATLAPGTEGGQLPNNIAQTVRLTIIQVTTCRKVASRLRSQQSHYQSDTKQRCRGNQRSNFTYVHFVSLPFRWRPNAARLVILGADTRCIPGTKECVRSFFH